MRHHETPRLTRRAAGLLLTALLAAPRLAFAFTQGGAGIDIIGNGIPMGHEWITRLAALELLGGDTVFPTRDPNDPRLKWKQGLAKNTDLANAQQEVARIKGSQRLDTRHASTYEAVFDAITGERWVDLGGFNVLNSNIGALNCHDAVTQEPAELQYDHFMRRYDDNDAKGGVTAAKKSGERFIQYFVDAAMASSTLMTVWDGGAASSREDVDRNYFLFGRAAHLFEDSFSSDHTVRISDDQYERVRQVKSYLCTPGSEQHSHRTESVLDYSSGDVIWLSITRLSSNWSSYTSSNMKPLALVAVEATKDLWAAFIRTMALPMAQREAAARAEAAMLVKNWMSMDEKQALAWYNKAENRDKTYVLATGQGGNGKGVPTCMREDLKVDSGDQMRRVKELEEVRRICLYNIEAEPGYSDLFDPALHMPFHWRWTSSSWQTPPPDWKIPERSADTGIRVRIKSASNSEYMSADDAGWIYCRKDKTPLDFILVGNKDDAYYRTANGNLFLSYRNSDGEVALYGTSSGADYKMEPQDGGRFAFRNLYWKQYIYLSGELPYLNKPGNPKNADSQWYVEGLK